MMNRFGAQRPYTPPADVLDIFRELEFSSLVTRIPPSETEEAPVEGANELAATADTPVTIVDTPGAYPGKGAEERGQSEAIARSTEKCLQIGVPLISVIVGEGGSGGAVAFATANRVAMLEHSVYSVITPEGCASILWKDSEKMREAAEQMRLTANELKTLGVIGECSNHRITVLQIDRIFYQ